MMRQRNNALYDSIIQPGSEFPLHPQQPQQTIVADVLQKMLTISALVNETVVQLRTLEGPADRSPGMGHNQGPPLSAEELDEIERTTANLAEQAPTVSSASDRARLVEQTESVTTRLLDKLRSALSEIVKGGLRELGKEMLKQFVWWAGLAYLLGELGQKVHDWLSLPLPWGQICLVTNR